MSAQQTQETSVQGEVSATTLATLADTQFSSYDQAKAEVSQDATVAGTSTASLPEENNENLARVIQSVRPARRAAGQRVKDPTSSKRMETYRERQQAATGGYEKGLNENYARRIVFGAGNAYDRDRQYETELDMGVGVYDAATKQAVLSEEPADSTNDERPGNEKRWSADEIFALFKRVGMDAGDKLTRAGQAKDVKMEIRTSGTHPIYRRQMPMIPVHREAYRALVKELVEAGAIRKCKSAWNSNTMIILKPGTTDKYRMVTNLKGLNMVTERHVDEPEPIAEQLQRLAGPTRNAVRFFAKTDLKSAFFQIKLDAGDQLKTAFTGPDNQQYCYTVAPMGARNSPAVLAQYLRRILSDCADWLVIQVDDLAIWADTDEELRERMAMMMSTLANHGLLLSPSKTEGGLQHMTFAGYTVSSGSISVADEKTEAVAQWQTPETREELASFLGFAQWLSPFIRHFEDRAAPLRRIMKRTIRDRDAVVWAPEELVAFTDIKTALVEAPSLGTFDKNRPLTLHMDACDCSGGSVLTQDGTIIAYHSFTMNQAQVRYTVREKELMSLVHAAKRYYSMFVTAPYVQVYTDHQALQYIFTTRAQTADRLERWACYLSQFDIRMFYKPGRDMEGIDALSRVLNRSRNPAQPDGDRAPMAATVAAVSSTSATDGSSMTVGQPDEASSLPPVWRVDVIAGYKEDPFFASLLPLLQPGGASARGKGKSKYYKQFFAMDADGLINAVMADGSRRPAIPYGPVRDFILEYVHEELAHASAFNMRRQIEEVYFIPGLADACKNLTAKCQQCYTAKPVNRAYGLSGRHDDPAYPFHTVSMDIATGMTLEDGFNAVIVFKCELTGFVVYAPTSLSATADELLDILETWVIRQHGYPRRLLSDNQSAFTSAPFVMFAGRHAITLVTSLPEHHQASVESAIATLRTQLRTLTDRDGRGWRKALTKCQLAANRAIPQRGEPISPSVALYGYQIPIPLLDPATGIMSHTATLATPGGNLSRISHTGLVDVYRERRGISADLHDRGRVNSSIAVGSFVAVPVHMAHIPVTKYDDNKALKGRPIYVGPFVVRGVAKGENYRVHLGHGVMGFFHVSSLKPLPAEAGVLAEQEGQPKDLLWPNGKPKVRMVDGKCRRYGKILYLVHYWGQHDAMAQWVARADVKSEDRVHLNNFDRRQAAGKPSMLHGKLVLDVARPPRAPFRRVQDEDDS